MKNKSVNKIWNAALYVRLSHDDGDKEESDSICNQKALIRSFIKNNPDIKAISDYEDDGYSGVDFERPAFKRLIADIHSGVINCVIVKDLSRLGRNYIEMGKLVEQFFPFVGVRFIAINDSYDSANHDGRTDSLIIPFKNLINDAYCADISKKIRSQFEVKRKKGDFIGSFAAFGYLKDPCNKHRLVIDEHAAHTVRDIFRWKIEGMSAQGIADRLNSFGVLSPLEYKKSIGSKYTTAFSTNYHAKWTAVAVTRILKNDLYTGILTQGITTTPNYKVKQRIKREKEAWVRIDNAHEPIITREDFVLVSELLLKDTRTAPDGDTAYLFSGMLYCGDCNRNLVRKNVPSAKDKYVYHICSTFKKGVGCKSHSISDKALNEAVFETLTLHINECVQIERILSFIENIPLYRLEAQRLTNQIDDKRARISKKTNHMVALHEDFKDGIVSKKEFITYKKIMAEQIADEEKALGELERELDIVRSNNGGNCLWIEHFKRYHNIQCLTRSVVVELIERITVFENGKIEVTFRYMQNLTDAMRYLETLPDKVLEKAVI